jgi:hypothetical protein
VPLHTSSNYAPPYGTASLGETLTVGVRLRNTSGAPVRGVKMMVEVQCASGRFRLGEMIHGAAAREDGTDPSQAESRTWDAIPQLMSDEVLELAGSHDIAELKDHILICSVAWETPDGRRTFQRFVKFMVSSSARRARLTQHRSRLPSTSRRAYTPRPS